MRTSFPSPSGIRLASACAVALAALLAAPAKAQFGQPANPGGPAPTMRADGVIASPLPYQVFQRGADGTADIPVTLDASVKDGEIQAALFSGPGSVVFADGKFVGVPTGGPYNATLMVKEAGVVRPVPVGPFFVGDLWVLAGQSNMEGVGDLIDVEKPNPMVSALGMDGKWGQATEPLHWLVDSPDPVHSGDPATREQRSAEQRKNRTKGAGLGLPFAAEMVKATRVPVGLIAAAHGGTSMGQWDPAKKGEGGDSLYGSMLRQIQLAGGRVKGVLWYQGESDSSPDASKLFEQAFTDFIAAVRADVGPPDLPFYYVQIGRFAIAGDSSGWERVREAQRAIPDRVANTAAISVIDLELDDAIHVGTQGLKRAGARLAKIAQRQLFGMLGATSPTFERAALGPNNTLEVKFRGVNMAAEPSPFGPSAGSIITAGLRPELHIAGFSIRDAEGGLLPLIFEAKVGRGRDTVVLKLSGAIPAGASLWYGHGYDPYCNLVDSADMAVPAFGPIALDPILPPPPPAAKPEAKKEEKRAETRPIKALVITGDEAGAHDWKATAPALKAILSDGGKVEVDVTETPAKDLTDENLAKYDVFVLNYRDTDKGGPDTKWSDANKEALLKAVRGGKGLVSYHFASSAFTNPNWEEYEKALGGWRKQGFHGPAHAFKVKKTDAQHPISAGLPAEFDHVVDELYQNSMLPEGAVVLATAFSDPEKPRGTGKDEAVIWVNPHGEGRVFTCVLGHDVEALNDPNVAPWIRRGTIWAGGGELD